MLIEKVRKEAKKFNLDDPDDILEYTHIISDPAVRILEKKYIQHTEVEAEGRSRTETKEVHMYVEWETCSL